MADLLKGLDPLGNGATGSALPPPAAPAGPRNLAADLDPQLVGWGGQQTEVSALLDSIDPTRNSAVTEGAGAPRAPQMSAQDQADQMLDSIDPRVSGWGPPKGTEQQHESSALGAFARSAERSALPTAGGLAGAAAGAEAGGALGAFAGPFGAGAGAFAGGVAGSIFGAGVVDATQGWAISKLSMGVQSLLGRTQEEQKADWEQHGVAALLGGVAPYALTASKKLGLGHSRHRRIAVTTHERTRPVTSTTTKATANGLRHLQHRCRALPA